MKITVTTHIKAPVEKVWEAFWQPEAVTKWNQASVDWHCPKSVSSEPKVGEIFSHTMAAKDGSMQFDFTARYDEVEPLKKLVFTLGEMKETFVESERQVEVLFEEEDSGVRVTETFDAETVNSEELQKTGWQAILDSFRDYVENENTD